MVYEKILYIIFKYIFNLSGYNKSNIITENIEYLCYRHKKAEN